jgi:hypothetical protein
MRSSLVLAALAAALFLGQPTAKAQVGLSVDIGSAPVCPYGYYDYAPYACAPWGYYGPGWFNGGVFIGAGPWFHGGPRFHGWVNNRYDPHYGYHGPMPRRGDRDGWDRDHWRAHPGHPYQRDFHGNQMRDGRGHEYHNGHPH